MSSKHETRSFLTSLPYQLLLDDIFPLLDVRSLTRLRLVSHTLKKAVDDDWTLSIAKDFHFPQRGNFRATNRLYDALKSTELYQWGNFTVSGWGCDIEQNDGGEGEESDTLRDLFMNLTSEPYWHTIVFPSIVRWKSPSLYDCRARLIEGNNMDRDATIIDENGNKKIQFIKARGLTRDHSIQAGVPIKLFAGICSFYALTNLGQILAWGKCGGIYDTSSTEFMFKKPTLLDLNGNRVKQLSVARDSAVALMTNGLVYEWDHRWDRPAVYSSESLLSEIPLEENQQKYSIRQIEAGIQKRIILADHQDSQSKSSEILMWLPMWTRKFLEEEWEEKAKQDVTDEYVIPPTWPLNIPIVRLPKPPKKFIKIALGDMQLIGLTEEGQIYCLRIPFHYCEPEEVKEIRQELREKPEEWKFLPLFSESIREAGLSEDQNENVWDRPSLRHLLSSKPKITNLSTHCGSFYAYAPDAGITSKNPIINEKTGEGLGIVLRGTEKHPTKPQIIPELQGIGAIKVLHCCRNISSVLTKGGKVLSWEVSPIIDPSKASTSEGGELTEDKEVLKTMTKAEKDRYVDLKLPTDISQSKLIRFGYPKIGERRNGRLIGEEDDMETKFVFDIASNHRHCATLAIDRESAFGAT